MVIRAAAPMTWVEATMSTYAFETPRGGTRLLGHCTLLESALRRRVPARKRLETALGRDEADRLVHALASDQDDDLERRGRRFRVRSSP
jgi:hypothetical protein